MKSVYMFPIWCVELFTWAKSFRNNPIIGNHLLNLLGLHVFRVVLSHLLFNFRLLLLSYLVSNADRQSFRKNGYILKQDFLPPEEFASLKHELQGYQGRIREMLEGDTVTQRVFLTQDELRHLPACTAFTRHRGLLRLLRYASSKNRIPFFSIENLKHHAVESDRADPQKDLHSDTFHPCIKAWLFIDAVDERNGPHVYVPGSHRLTWKRLKWEYRESLKASRSRKYRNSDRYWDGSFRVSDEDLREMGCAAPMPMHVPANTLLIGNVHGFHRRGHANKASTRMTIWMQARDNPFNPLIFPFPRLAARVFEAVWCRYLDRMERRMVGSGQWRIHAGRFDIG
jgi:hypothetical protein